MLLYPTYLDRFPVPPKFRYVDEDGNVDAELMFLRVRRHQEVSRLTGRVFLRSYMRNLAAQIFTFVDVGCKAFNWKLPVGRTPET